MNDPIYGTWRLHKQSKVKDLGNLKSGDAGGDDQYKWWNSETQSNWWDGYIRNAFLLDDQQAIEKVKSYINRILTTQDPDGYIGIYDKELRYKFTSENGELWSALRIYLERIKACTTPTGGAIGDEWIGGRQADVTHTGYEYCSLHELMDSYTALFQKGGGITAAEAIETIFYNAAQGSRNPDHSCIAYLKTDNSFEMTGTRNGEVEPDRKQTRYKYSPVHQDVAVCCVPNAGRISPYFLQCCWFKESENTLLAGVLGPNILETTIQNVPVKIEEITEYPYQNHFIFSINRESDFIDLTYSPAGSCKYEFITDHRASFKDGKIRINLKNKTTQKPEKLELIPLGKTILRQVSF